MRSLILPLALISLPAVAAAQPAGHGYSTRAAFDTTRAGGLYARVESATFLDNHEYASPHLKGATYAGAWARPMFEYYFNNKLRAQLGINALRYNGGAAFADIDPWFSIEYRPTEHLRMLLGNLDCWTQNPLAPHLYDPTLLMTKPTNAGLQLDYRAPWLATRAWIDWERYIAPGDPFQEIFTAALSNRLTTPRTANGFRISLPINIIGRHHGGEIDASDQRIETLMNYAAGLEGEIEGPKWNFNLAADFIYFQDVTNGGRRPVTNGKGVEARLGARSRQLSIEVNYWHSDNYYAPLGHPIYHSWTPWLPQTIFRRQHLAGAKASFAVPAAQGVRLLVEGQYWRDLPNRRNNFTLGVKMLIGHSFLIKHFDIEQ